MIAAILALAAVLRFYDLHRLPPGLWFDEGLNGLNALSILHDQPVRLYFDNREFFGGQTKFGQEPMYHYLLALAIAIMGPTALAIRATSAVIGVATVGVFYGMVRTIWGRGTALLATVLLALFRWHVHFSRIGFRTILAPLFACLFFWLWWHGVEKGKRLSLILAGVCLGLGLYTYPAFQLIVPVWICLVLLRVWREKDRRRDLGRALLWPTIAALIVLLPLVGYFATHPEVAAGRVGSLTVFEHAKEAQAKGVQTESGWQMLAENACDNVRHFWWRGDHVAKHNVPLMAVFDPLTSAIFAVGIIVTLVGVWRDPRNALLLLWAAWLACASIFSFGAPNLLRTVGMVPAIVLLLANGYLWIARRIESALSRQTAALVLVVLVGWFGANEARRYFLTWRQHPLVPQEFNAPYRELAEAVIALGEGVDVHIPGDYYHHFTLRYLLYGRNNIHEMQMPDSLARQPDTTRDRVLVFTGWTFPPFGLAGAPPARFFPRGRLVWAMRDGPFAAFEVPVDNLMTAEQGAEATRGLKINPHR